MGRAISPVGQVLREWRSAQGMSQLDLALTAGVSSRHISFVETGRSRPSREMVLRLAESLQLPLRERNALLVAAGFAPVYRESSLDDPGLEPVRRALELVLRSHEPLPAFVLDRGWDIVLANRAHERLLGLLLPPGASIGAPANAIELLFDPGLLRRRVLNWETVAHVLGHRVRRSLRVPDLDDRLRERFERWLALPGVADAMQRAASPPASAVLIPLELDLSGRRLSLFSTIATIGTPQDITLEELRIESLFAADAATEEVLRATSSTSTAD